MAIKQYVGKDHISPFADSVEVTPIHAPLVCQILYTGRVLAVFEKNGYNDSDFVATVWQDNAPFDIVYRTTRAWSYPNSAEVDATPEVRAAYDEYVRAKREASKRAADETEHNRIVTECAKLRITAQQLAKLKSAYHYDSYHYAKVAELLATKRFRSSFRKSLAEHVRSWLDEPTPKYLTPLSLNQARYLK